MPWPDCGKEAGGNKLAGLGWDWHCDVDLDRVLEKREGYDEDGRRGLMVVVEAFAHRAVACLCCAVAWRALPWLGMGSPCFGVPYHGSRCHDVTWPDAPWSGMVVPLHRWARSNITWRAVACRDG